MGVLAPGKLLPLPLPDTSLQSLRERAGTPWLPLSVRPSGKAAAGSRVLSLVGYCQPSGLQQPLIEEEDLAVMCEQCSGKGWLLCDFCKGQKTNVRSETNRIYRRCPQCKAVGCILCSKCKVYKCVAFPDYGDGELSQ